MSIPYKMRPTGFDSWYVRLQRDLLQLLGSSEKFELAWIAPEKKLIIHTDRVDADVLAEVAAIAAELVPSDIEVVQYNHNMEISWKDINKYAECVTVDDMLAVNPDYKTDLTSEGEWIYPLPNLRNAYWAFKDSPMRKFSVELPSVTNATGMFKNTALEGEMTLSLPKVSFWSQIFDNTASSSNRRKLTKITLIGNPAINARIHQTFAQWNGIVDDYLEEVNIFGFTAPEIGADSLCLNCRGLKRFRSDLAGQVTQWASGAMSKAQLDKESVLDIVRASYIGDTTGKIANWGIHVDLQNDEEVWAAIHNVEANGWIIVVNWNPGGPTYTTPAT